MGQNTGANSKGKKEEVKREQVEEEEEEEEQEEQDGVSVHSPCKPPSSSLRKVFLSLYSLFTYKYCCVCRRVCICATICVCANMF